MTADDLRQVGYTVDDETTPGTLVVSGLAQTWTIPADDADTIAQVYALALTADNIALRTQAEAMLAALTADLDAWDTLDDAAVKAATRTTIQVLVNLVRLTIRRYGG